MSDASSPAPKKRKWHTKDQMGCTRCKARRVKCEKSQPSCQNCVRRGETCIYPGHQISPRADTDGDDISLLSRPRASELESSFTALDLELFHRFITTDYPPLPADSVHTWTQVMPVYAHEYDFLMHAILACSATDTTGEQRPGLRVIALHHRTVALNRMWGTMAVVNSTQTSSKARDAAIGACYLLIVQCFRLQDGWTDFLPLIRGVDLVAKAVQRQGDDSAWIVGQTHTTVQRMNEGWREGRIERPHPPLMSGMLASFRLVETECHVLAAQTFLNVLIASATALDQNDTWKGYEELQSIWKVLSDTDCEALSDSSNPCTRVLIAHWLAMMLLLKPFYDLEMLVSQKGIFAQVPIWIFDISRVASRDSDGTEKALQWPLEIASAFSARESG